MGKYNFKNCILLIVADNSNFLDNLDFIYKYYKSYFKKIIIYCIKIKEIDIRKEENYPQVNFLDSYLNININDVLLDFYDKYKITLQCADGLFYIHMIFNKYKYFETLEMTN